jgi:predicted membrane protein (TIGR00267 family)
MTQQHHRPLHRMHKRPTYRQHISARRHERAVAVKIAGAQEMPLPELPSTPAAVIGGQPLEHVHTIAEDLHDWILGGQDGLVNVLGSILGVAVVTQDRSIVLVAGLASLFAESVSMAAVAYTSVRASHLHYHSQYEERARLIEENPVLQREILIDAYERKGVNRAEAVRIVDELTKDKAVWLRALMEEHLRLFRPEESGPVRSAVIVGFSSLLGALIPLTPFFFLDGTAAIVCAIATSLLGLFIAGAIGAKLTVGDWRRRGAEMVAIGGAAAAISFTIGYLFVSGIIPV